MAARPLILNPSYLAMVRGVRELHRLSAEGKDDSPEADAIRDATDQPWQALSEIERQRVRHLSEDLYSLSEPPPTAIAMTLLAQAGFRDAVEAQQRGEWDRALDLWRKWQAYFDPVLVNAYRGAIWLEAGDPETAVLFLEHSAMLRPEDRNYLALFLHALASVDPTAARVRSEELLRNSDNLPPEAIFSASDIVLKSALKLMGTNADHVLRRLIPVLHATLAKIKNGDEAGFDRDLYTVTIELLGRCHEFLGETQKALNCYTEGLRTDPNNDSLLVTRGMLLYGLSPQAISDFELALQNASNSIWPHFFLAHHSLITGSYEKCQNLCDRALRFSGSNAVKSELCEWMAIAQTELGFSQEIVRSSFEKAMRLEPGNIRARDNLAIFEKAFQNIANQAWETPSATAVRTLGLTESRFAFAA